MAYFAWFFVGYAMFLSVIFFFFKALLIIIYKIKASSVVTLTIVCFKLVDEIWATQGPKYMSLVTP